LIRCNHLLFSFVETGDRHFANKVSDIILINYKLKTPLPGKHAK
jgi:hypothetical protein